MKINYFYFQTKLPTKDLLLPLIISLGLNWLSISLAQADNSFVRKAETIENDELNTIGISNPVGLVFSLKGENLLILEESEGSTEETEIVAVSLVEGDSSSSVTIPTDIPEPINTVFDSKTNRFLAINPETDAVIEVDANNNGELKEQPTATTETVAPGALSLDDPQGMTADPDTGSVYILDSGEIVRVVPKLDSEGFKGANVTKVNLPPQAGRPEQLRGIAFNPNDGLVYVFNSAQQKLHGVTKNGELISSRDLSKFGLSSTQSILFAPSGDTTDDPSQMSLYIVDQGLTGAAGAVGAAGITANNSESQTSLGSVETEDTTPNSRVIELSFVEPPALQAAAATGTLVQVMNLSQLNNPHLSPARLGIPDPSGVTYIPVSDSMLIVDGEVEETTGAPSSSYNVFEVNYGFNVPDIDRLLDVFTVVLFPFSDARFGPAFSNEPTGISAINPDNGHIFISDDDPVLSNNQQSIFEVAPGPDGTFATPDDVVSTIRLTDLTPGGIKDPEGIAYGEVSSGKKRVFIAGGSDHEVYWVDLGANGILDLNDPVSQFDTWGVGLTDPEGIEFDPDTGTLYVIGEPINQVFEFKVDGTFVKTFDISAALPGKPGVPSGQGLNQPAGLTLAPGTDGSHKNLYIVDRGLDNDQFPTENDGQLFEISIGDSQDGTETVNISSRVASRSDDAEERDASGFVTTTNGDLDLTASLGDTQTTGIRFLLDVPSSVTIVNAYIQFTADEVRSTATSLKIKGQKIGNAPTFTTANRNISGRTTTRNSITWSSIPSWNNVGDAGSAQRTPDLSSIIQEIINGSSWSSGNGVAIIITGTGKRPAETYDADPEKAAVLHVEYRP